MCATQGVGQGVIISRTPKYLATPKTLGSLNPTQQNHPTWVIRRGIQPQGVQIPLKTLLFADTPRLGRTSAPPPPWWDIRIKFQPAQGSRLWQKSVILGRVPGGPWRPLEVPRGPLKKTKGESFIYNSAFSYRHGGAGRGQGCGQPSRMKFQPCHLAVRGSGRATRRVWSP